MSFLPHGSPRAVPWYGSFAASFAAHAGIVSFVLFSGVVVLVPTPPERETPEITVSLEILDAAFVEELEPVDDSNLVPEDAEITAPEDILAETPDELAALAPDEDLLAPEEQLLEPEPEISEPEVVEPEPLEPEVSAPEVVEPEPLAPEVTEPEPEVIEPQPAQPEVAELLPEPEPEPLPEPEVIAPEPTAPEPEVVAEVPDLPDPTPIAPQAPEPTAPQIEDLLAIDDAVVNPLGEGGSAVLPPDDILPLTEEFAALAPEPEQPEATILAPEVVEEAAPIVLPQESTEEPAETAPVPEVAALLPEIVEETPQAPAEVAEDPAEPATPAAPAVQPLANPTASDVAIGQLLRRIRATAQEQCTLALPRRAGGDALAGLAMIGADEAVLDAQALVILDGLDFVPVQTRELLDPRQCATLDALRASDSYPANRIGLSLDRATLRSGDLLTGRVLGAGGLFVTLLLVDDNGVVQDLAPFVSLDGNTPVFEAPVARSGPARATRQVLVAIGTTGAPLDLSDRIGQEAQDVFGPIPSNTLQTMVFGVATFDVQ